MEASPFAATQPLPSEKSSVLFALSKRERALFFGGGQVDLSAKASCEWVDGHPLEGEDWLRALESSEPEILVTGWTTPPLPANWLAWDQNPLRYVCHVGGSVRSIVPREFIERGGLVTNWGNIVACSVAEHALLMALALLRNVPEWRPFIESDSEPSPHAIEALGTRRLAGRHVGIHGFGAVARELTKLLAPFNVTISAYSEGVPGSLFAECGVRQALTLEELFAGSHVLFECEALTEKTCQSVNAAILGFLPDDAVFVNVGRGWLVDEDALIQEARKRRLRVATDVAVSEPLSRQSPYYPLRGVLLSPHIAGPTQDDCLICGDYAQQNIRRYLSGLRPESVLSLAAYDRMT